MADSNLEPPIVEVRNPVTYLRRWWDKVMGKEGAYFSFRVPPITAFLIAFGLTAGGFSIGKYSSDIPLLKFVGFPTSTPVATQTPTTEWRETAYTGKLQYSVSSQKYFLLTTSSEAITLEVNGNLDLLKLVGKRIFAVGEYNKQTRVLKVSDVKDLEILPNTPIPLPTIESKETPVATPTATSDTIEISTQGGELN